MRVAGRGSVVNVSSISGHVGVPGIPRASYAASKLGLSGLAAELAVQWARHGAPEDFTGAVLWLARDASQYVTGQTILVDGGWTAR